MPDSGFLSLNEWIRRRFQLNGKIRILVAKPGLDGHDRGARIISRVFRDAGFEVVYTGLHQTPEQIVDTAIQEDVHVIGLSFLSGAYLGLTAKITQLLKEKGASDKQVIVGGTILREDIEKLKELGVAEVFPTGTSLERPVEFVKRIFGLKSQQ